MSPLCSKERLHPYRSRPVTLKMYTGEAIKVLGALPVVVKYHHREEGLFVQVVDREGPNLLGTTG